MQFFQSLLCMRGFDSGRRFLVVNLICYGFFFLLSSVLLKAPVLLVLLLLVTSPVMVATAIRRMNDAGFSVYFAGLPILSYWLAVFGITYISHGAAYALLVISFLATIAMTTISNARVRRNRDYVFGYSGPVYSEQDENPLAQRRFYDRIEPTLAAGHEQGEQAAGSNAQSDIDLAATNRFHGTSSTRSNGPSFEDKVGEWIMSNLGLTAGIVVLLVAVIGGSFWLTGDSESGAEETKQPQVAETTKQRLNKIRLPDKFYIMLDLNDALTVGWQGDLMEDGDLWSAMTGKGDRTCFQLRFNGGESYRVMKVEVKNQGDYYADFSPIDTFDIVEGIAKKSSFSLCGFDFSLKGTQSILMTNKAYFNILTRE